MINEQKLLVGAIYWHLVMAKVVKYRPFHVIMLMPPCPREQKNMLPTGLIMPQVT